MSRSKADFILQFNNNNNNNNKKKKRKEKRKRIVRVKYAVFNECISLLLYRCKMQLALQSA
jgi:hypothetical protein